MLAVAFNYSLNTCKICLSNGCLLICTVFGTTLFLTSKIILILK